MATAAALVADTNSHHAPSMGLVPFAFAVSSQTVYGSSSYQNVVITFMKIVLVAIFALGDGQRMNKRRTQDHALSVAVAWNNQN